MKKKKIALSLIISLTLFSTILGVTSSAGFGSGVAVVASEAKIIKSAIFGQKIVFSDLDFKQGLAITDFEKIKITAIPKSSEGTLLLAGRRVSEGTIIKRKNLGAMVFIPASKDISECSFKFSTDDFAEGKEVVFILKFTDKINYAPQIYESTDASLDTQREISVFGRLEATDAEGDEIEYMIVSYPKVGTLTLVDKNTGEYIYTPTKDYIGTETFSYVAMDEWGNFSTLSKIKIEVGERMSEVVYSDMVNHPQNNAAVALTAMGIMDGKIIGDGTYFMPDETVSRAEFLAMAMKAASISGDNSTSASYFDDNDRIPKALLPYVKRAANLGIITGDFKDGKLLFRPNDTITKYEAGVILSRIVNATESTAISFSDSDTIPVWARDEIYAICSTGIINYDGDSFNGKTSLTKADTALYLYNMLRYFEKN